MVAGDGNFSGMAEFTWASASSLTAATATATALVAANFF